MSMNRSRLLALAVGVATGSMPALTAKASDIASLDPVVVSATRSPVDLKNAPASVSVITADDIAGMTVMTIDEALQNTVGVMVRRTKGFMETTPALTIRGKSQAKDNLVLVDGIPQNDSNNGQVNWLMIDPENVERIEVLRGPFSSLYGGNAVGGVVSIFTKAPESTGVFVKLGYGGELNSTAPDDFSDLFVRGTLRATDSLSVAAFYRKRATDGYPTTHVNVSNAVINNLPSTTSGWIPYETNIGAASNLVGYTGDNWFKDNTGGFTVKFDPGSDTQLTLSWVKSESEYGYTEPQTLLRTTVDHPTLGLVSDIPTLEGVPLTSWLNGAVFARGGHADQWNAGLNLRTQWGATAASVTLGRIDRESGFVIVGGAVPAVSPVTLVGGDGRTPSTDTTRTTLDVQFDRPLTDAHLLTFGLAGARGELDNERWNLSDWTNTGSKVLKTSDATGEDKLFALYIQDAWTVNDQWTVYLGARMDWWEFDGGSANFYAADGSVTRTDNYASTDGNQFSPKLSVVYRASEATAWRASAGRAFRAPMLFELIQTTGIAGQTFVGNPDLDPETVDSIEFGVNHTFPNRINLNAAAYYSKANDLIQTQTISAPGVTPAEISPRNVGKAEIKGLELEIGGPLPFGFTWYANYTYTDTEVKENKANPSIEGNNLLHAPEDQYNLGVEWRYQNWRFNANHYYQSKRYTRADNLDTNTGVPGSTDSFRLTDVKLGYMTRDGYGVSLGVTNLFDEEYNQFYRSPGRFWFLELRSHF